MLAREWMSEVFGAVLRIAAIGMAWTSIEYAVGAGWRAGMGILGVVGLIAGIVLLRKADSVVHFTYGRRTEPAIRQP